MNVVLIFEVNHKSSDNRIKNRKVEDKGKANGHPVKNLCVRKSQTVDKSPLLSFDFISMGLRFFPVGLCSIPMGLRSFLVGTRCRIMA